MKGWVKEHRKMMEWEWYTDVNTCHLFRHLILKANHKDKSWRGTLIKRGQLITSRDKLAEETGLSPQQIRTALNKLKSTSNITSHATNRFTLIEVLNYSVFQGSDDDEQPASQPASQPTSNQPPNQQITTNKNVKKGKNEKNKRNNTKEVDDFFERAWNLYPKKTGKGSISQSTKNRAFKLGDEFIRSIERYKTYITENGTEKKYIKAGSTFWNSGYVDFLDENFKDAFGDIKTDDEKEAIRAKAKAEDDDYRDYMKQELDKKMKRYESQSAEKLKNNPTYKNILAGIKIKGMD